MIKRLFDIVAATAGLISFFPVLIFIAYKVKKEMGAPIFFRQIRPGKDGKPFEMIKFRSMKNEYDERGNLLPNEQRLTSFGKKLRSTSLDELPELWNVLMGDMSLVGPRPLLIEYLPLYNKEQQRRHNVRPGITGWAQINGRNAISWESKFNYDIWYVDNFNILLDVKIIFLTINKVIFRDGINNSSEVTMPKFTGTKND